MLVDLEPIASANIEDIVIEISLICLAESNEDQFKPDDPETTIIIEEDLLEFKEPVCSGCEDEQSHYFRLASQHQDLTT